MPQTYSVPVTEQQERAVDLPVSVVIAVRNERHNLRRCLQSLSGAGEVFVVDSQSTDGTQEIACSYDAQVVQFYYCGGWPKKRQWALDNLTLRYDWVMLLDADEALTPELAVEMRRAMKDSTVNGYYIALEMNFLGRRLRYGGASFYKLSLFRRGTGRFECRFRDQDNSMCDMEVHEHVIVDGATKRLKNKLSHNNAETIARYIQKHNEYSNWEARVRMSGKAQDLRPRLFGSQAQRRRWLKKHFFNLPGSSVGLFLYRYIFRLGFLDGIPGLIYCGFQGIQVFAVKAKMYEMKLQRSRSEGMVANVRH